jgi:hypothetical protein
MRNTWISRTQRRNWQSVFLIEQTLMTSFKGTSSEVGIDALWTVDAIFLHLVSPEASKMRRDMRAKAKRE